MIVFLCPYRLPVLQHVEWHDGNVYEGIEGASILTEAQKRGMQKAAETWLPVFRAANIAAQMPVIDKIHQKKYNNYMKRICGVFLLFCLFSVSIIFCEEAITEFDEKFAISFFGNYNVGIFMQDQTQGFKTDEPWRIGLGFRYKKYAAFFSVPIDFKFNSFDAELNSYFEKIYIEAFLKRYQSYFNEKENEPKNAGLDIMSAGITSGWIHNNQNHSLNSVYSLNEKQNISNSSFLYGFGIYYTSLYSDNIEIKRYNERNHLIHFGPTAGYSYTWVLSNNIFIHIGIDIGANLGINITENRSLFIPQIKPKISFGHHNRRWSINAVIGNNAAILLRDVNNFDILAPATITVTFLKRF